MHCFQQYSRTHPWVKRSHVKHITDAHDVEELAEWQAVQIAGDQLALGQLAGIVRVCRHHRAVPQHFNGRYRCMGENGKIRIRNECGAGSQCGHTLCVRGAHLLVAVQATSGRLWVIYLQTFILVIYKTKSDQTYAINRCVADQKR